MVVYVRLFDEESGVIRFQLFDEEAACKKEIADDGKLAVSADQKDDSFNLLAEVKLHNQEKGACCAQTLFLVFEGSFFLQEQTLPI